MPRGIPKKKPEIIAPETHDDLKGPEPNDTPDTLPMKEGLVGPEEVLFVKPLTAQLSEKTVMQKVPNGYLYKVYLEDSFNKANVTLLGMFIK